MWLGRVHDDPTRTQQGAALAASCGGELDEAEPSID